MESQPKEWKDTKVAAQQPVEWKKLDLGIYRTPSDCCLDGNFKTNHLHCQKRKEVFV